MNSSTGTVIGVIGGGTGAGATTLVAGCATRARLAGRRVAAIDADPYGGGLDLVFGLETEPGVRWEQLAGVAGELDGERLWERLPGGADGLAVVSHGRGWQPIEEQVRLEVVTALRSCADLVILDLGRVSAGERLLQSCGGVVLVARGSAQGLAAAGATAQQLTREVDGLVVRDPAPAHLAEVEEGLGIPVVGCFTTDRQVQTDLARGAAPGGRRGDFATSCDELLRELLIERAEAAA